MPNPCYSGPTEGHDHGDRGAAYTTDNAQFDALLGGNLDIGYAADQDITKPTTNPSKAGTNNPRLDELLPDALGRLRLQLRRAEVRSTGDGGNAGDIYKQLYVRQAHAERRRPDRDHLKVPEGYGVPTYGPVPVLPKNAFVDSYEQKNPYPYNPANAKSLLTSHGGRSCRTALDTCEKPGTGLERVRRQRFPRERSSTFTMAYAAGTLWQQQVMQVEQSAWNAIGIKTQLVSNTFPTVISSYAPLCMTGFALHDRRRLVGRRLVVRAGLTTRLVRPSSPPVRAATPATTAAPRPTP